MTSSYLFRLVHIHGFFHKWNCYVVIFTLCVLCPTVLGYWPAVIMTSGSFLPSESSSLPALPAQCSDYLFIRLKLNSSLHIGYAELGHTQLLYFWQQTTSWDIFMRLPSSRWTTLLTSSSLYQDRDSAVRMNQYSFDPPFMMLMLIVSQPFLITYTVRKKCRRRKKLNRHRKEADG